MDSHSPTARHDQGSATVQAQFGVVVCEPDARYSEEICHLVDSTPGLHVVAACTIGLHVLEIARRVPVAAVVLAGEVVGTSPIDIASELRRLSPECQVVLVSHDRDARTAARRLGLFGGVSRQHFLDLPGTLQRLSHYLADPERRPLDRRTGADRRQRQTWLNVTRERRSGLDRRVRDLPHDHWPGVG